MFLAAVAVSASAAACQMLGPTKGPRYPGKNVLVISIDTLRPDHLASYGYSRVTSPTIDALAGRGVTFEQAFAPRGSTWPSLATMLTSLSPLGHNVRENGQYMAPGTTTIADILHEKGYAARAFVSGTVCHMTRKVPAFEKIACGEDRYVTERAVNFLRTHDERPFFAWVHLIAPHGPFMPPPEYDKWTKPDYSGPIGRGEQVTLAAFIRSQKPLTDADRAQLYGLYDGEILFADALVKQILDELAARGLADNTIIAFLADHGEELADHNGYLYHSCSVYDSVLRIPLMIALPDGAGAGRRVSQIVETEDLTPTLLELLEVPALPSFEGQSLVSLLEGRPGDEDRVAWAEWYDKVSRNTVQTVRSSRWRYVANPHNLTPRCPPMGDYYKVKAEELYDHRTDPLDLHDVRPNHPDVAEQYAKLAAAKNAESGEDAPQELDPNLLEELRSFGYVE